MVSKFISIPFTVVVILSVFGAVSYVGGGFGSFSLNPESVNPIVYYDVSGVAKVYANVTSVDEVGTVVFVREYCMWDNDTKKWGVFGFYPVVFSLYTDELGEVELTRAVFEENKNVAGSVEFGVSLTSAVALIAGIVGLMALAAVLGLKLFGSGEDWVSVSMILKFTGFLGLWGVFSVPSLTLLSHEDIPYSLGLVLYFLLCVMLVMGLIDSIGNSSGGGD